MRKELQKKLQYFLKKTNQQTKTRTLTTQKTPNQTHLPAVQQVEAGSGQPGGF